MEFNPSFGALADGHLFQVRAFFLNGTVAQVEKATRRRTRSEHRAAAMGK